MMDTETIRRLGGPLLHDYLLEAARRSPHAVAVTERSRRATFAELERRSRELAAYLIDQGVEPGDRVIVFGDNSIDTIVVFWGVLRASAVVSLVNPQTKADKLAFLLNDCRAAALFADARTAKVAAAALPRAEHTRLVLLADDVDESSQRQIPRAVALDAARVVGAGEPPRRAIDVDLASIIYTSGSTGTPKGVMHTHRSMLTAALSVSSYLEMTEHDSVLVVLPLSFDYGLYQVIMAARVGARVVLERSFAYPVKVLQVIEDQRVTGLPGVPTLFALLARTDTVWTFDLSHVRFVTSTAALLTRRQIAFLRELFPTARIYSMYGLTECQRCTYLPPGDLAKKPDSVGIAIPNTELWVVDEKGRRLPPGQAGELVIRGGTVMRGYWERPEATAERLRPGPLPGEHTLYTGDLCRLDDDGYVYFLGRKDDIIKSRGEKVAPREVERVLLELDSVLEAAVIGVADPILGEAVKAFVVLERGVAMSAADVQRATAARLEGYMVPKHVEVVETLPKTLTGKIDKTQLR